MISTTDAIEPTGRGRGEAGRFLVFILLVAVALGVLFDRTWRFDEVLSPGDLLESFYPWAYDGPRREPTNPTRSDEAFYHQPLMMTHWARLAKGDFPEWDPLVLSGVPAFNQALDLGRVYSPLSLPFFLLPPDRAVTVYAPLRLLCAALLMWLYLRHAGLSPAARAAGAVAFALNGAFIVWLSAPMPTVALWLPLLVMAVERACTSARAADAALLALALGLQFLGSYLPTSLVVLALGGLWSTGWLCARYRQSAGLPPGRPALVLLAGGVAGAALAAVCLWPMLATLTDSPAASRAVQAATLPWQNLATFALPDFWGTPLLRNWWYPGQSNYPELVTYLGVASVALAGTGTVAALVRRDPRGVLALAVGLVAIGQMYGVPPLSWLSDLPGFRQTNPYRWNVALAFAVAVLAATGLDAMVRQPRHRLLLLAGGLGTLLALAAVTAAVVIDQLPAIRSLSLQPFEKGQLARFALVATVSGGLMAVVALRREGLSVAGAWGLVLVVAAELVHAGYGFNPTLARDQLYRTTPALQFLQAEIGQWRLAPVGASHQLVQGHVWGVYGLPEVTGFDFHGDRHYQRFISLAQGLTALPPRWNYVGLVRGPTVNLSLLGLLGARFLVTPPLDAVTEGPGFTTVGELVDRRVVRQSFVARSNGLYRLDLLAATFGRTNEGTLEISIGAAERGQVLGTWRVAASEWANLDWMRFEFPPESASRGARYTVEVRAIDCPPGRAPTLLATQEGGLADAVLEIDGAADRRTLWLRTFASAPDRFPGAPLVYARDLNVYLNPLALPAAWFVREARGLPLERHFETLADPSFDPKTTALMDADAGDTTPTSARVLRVDARDPDRPVVDVEAPGGGVVVFSVRHHRGWSLTADGRPASLVRANGVLMAAVVPPGTRQLVLEFRAPFTRPALWVSAVTLAGIAVALARRKRVALW